MLTREGSETATRDVVEHRAIAQATVSQQLKVLKEVGWIDGEIQGPATCYCLQDRNVRWVRVKVGAIF